LQASKQASQAKHTHTRSRQLHLILRSLPSSVDFFYVLCQLVASMKSDNKVSTPTTATITTTTKTTTKMSSKSFANQQQNYFNKFLIILIVILINCIVGNSCAWQDNVRPKLFVQLGELL